MKVTTKDIATNETKVTTNNETKIRKKSIAKFDDENSTKKANETKTSKKQFCFCVCFSEKNHSTKCHTSFLFCETYAKLMTKNSFAIRLSFVNYVTHELNVVLFFHNLKVIDMLFFLLKIIKMRIIFCN